MKVKLYNETPKHRDNFVKLVEEGFYDSLLFHRVIDKFMIQGGDPESKNAPADKRLGNGGPGYQIDAEINKALIHKRGALAAARQGNNVNPERKSSGSQFYIVEGQKFTDEDLDQIEKRMNSQLEQKLFYEIMQDTTQKALRDEYEQLRAARDREGFEVFFKEKIQPILDEKMKDEETFAFTDEQREVYKTIGGTPHLDGEYTVFGELYEGFDVLDSISNVKTASNNRPAEDVIMEMEIIQ